MTPTPASSNEHANSTPGPRRPSGAMSAARRMYLGTNPAGAWRDGVGPRRVKGHVLTACAGSRTRYRTMTGPRFGEGHVYTHEIDACRAEVARANLEVAGVEALVTLVPGDGHDTVKRYGQPGDPLFVDVDRGQSTDMLFLDADKQGYLDYLEKLMPLIRPGGLIIAHNMNTRQADLDFVKAVTTDPQLETLILLREGTGVGVTLKKR